MSSASQAEGPGMSNEQRLYEKTNRQSDGAPAWWVVCSRELAELWMGGYASVLIVIFCAVQAGIAYSLSADFGRTPRQEMVYMLIESCIAAAVFMGVILGADTLSGERERGTLEAILLTPASRRQIIFGKLLAAASVWPAALAVTIPCIAFVADGVDGFLNGLKWGTLLGTLTVTGFTGLGMLVSFWSNSNKTSLFASLVAYFCFVLPTMFPWETQVGTFGIIMRRANPMESNRHLLDKTIVSVFPIGAYWRWLLSPVLLAVIALGILFFYASRNLRLEASGARAIFKPAPPKPRRAAASAVAVE
jgi:ABC-type transport system involved in multi-copper enzyme maturation permease subunit